MTATAYINARLLDPASGLDESGTLVTENGLIRELGADTAPVKDGAIVDCGGRVLAPGLIDMLSFSPDVKSAAAGGITTAVLAPDQSPVTDNAAMVEHRLKHRPITILPAGAATQGLAGVQIAEIGLMSEAGAVLFTDGRQAVADATVMRRLLEYARAFDALIMQHVEEPSLARDGVAGEGELATRLGLKAIPTEAEVMMLERDAWLVKLTGGRYHAAQITSADAIAAMRMAKENRLAMTCGTAAHYFSLNENAIGDYRTFAKASPPLRDEADRQAVVNGLTDGTIDVICSAHDPRDEEEKRLPFAQAAPGMVGYETMLPLALELYHNGGMDLLSVIKCITARPAEILGLESGRLAAGAPADLVIFDLDKPWRIDVEAFESPTKNSPFDGRPVQGRVWRTVAAGQTVYMRND